MSGPATACDASQRLRRRPGNSSCPANVGRIVNAMQREGASTVGTRRRLLWVSVLAGATGSAVVVFMASARPGALLFRSVLERSSRGTRADPARSRDGVASITDEHYEPGHPDARLDVYFPASAAPGERLPTVVWVHGGAWISGAKDVPAHYFEMLARGRPHGRGRRVHASARRAVSPPTPADQRRARVRAVARGPLPRRRPSDDPRRRLGRRGDGEPDRDDRDGSAVRTGGRDRCVVATRAAARRDFLLRCVRRGERGSPPGRLAERSVPALPAERALGVHR